jgi:NAD(P)-dependent dehydrogenase (short-subunit alcohol dehydrogenase family)
MSDRERDYWSTRTCVVTGGAGGQGAAEVRNLIALGAAVVAVDRIPDDAPEWATLRQSADAGERLVTVSGDITEDPTWDRVLDAVTRLDRPLAGLVNNAGITLRKTVTQTSLDEWENLIRVNLTGSFMGIRRLADSIVDGGAIVNVSSTAGLTGYFSAAYTASKWAVRGLAKAAAIELAPRGIRVNTICPGLVDTPMALTVKPGHDADQIKGWYEGNLEMTPLGRGASPDELADAALFLLGPHSSFITGTDLAVDGGMIGAGIYTYVGQRSGTIPEQGSQI